MKNVCSFQREHKCHSVFTHQAENECICLAVQSFEYAKSFKYASLWAAAHRWVRRLTGFSSPVNRGIKWRCIHASNLVRLHPTSPLHMLSHAFLSRLGTQPENSEWCQSPFHYPEVFQVNNPKSHENTNLDLPLQGADILKSKHSGQAETELVNALKSFLKVRRYKQGFWRI